MGEKKKFNYRDFSKGLNALPPGIRIADNQYARYSQDLRRDRRILETREKWTYALNNPMFADEPVNGIFVWGERGNEYLTIVPNPVGFSGNTRTYTLPLDAINLNTRQIDTSKVYSGTPPSFQHEYHTFLPINGVQYQRDLVFSESFDDAFDHFGQLWRQWYITEDGRVWNRAYYGRIVMLGTVVASFNHRLYFGNTQIGQSHIFYSGPGKALPAERITSHGWGPYYSGPFQWIGPAAARAGCDSYWCYQKAYDMFSYGSGGLGGGYIELPTEYGEITAFVSTRNALFVFTRKSIWKIGLDNSVRLICDFVGTLSQQTVVQTPWGITFLGFDRKLYSFDGVNPPKQVGHEIYNYLDDAYMDVPLYLERSTWKSHTDFIWRTAAPAPFSNVVWDHANNGLKIATGALTGWWTSNVWKFDDAIRILNVKPTYLMLGMNAPNENDEEFLSFFYRFDSNSFAYDAGTPPNWIYIGSAWNRCSVVDPPADPEYIGTADLSPLDYYPRPFGRLDVAAGTAIDASIDSARNDHYSQIKVNFGKHDVGENEDTGPILTSIIATVLRGNMSKVTAAPNMGYAAEKLRINLSIDTKNSGYPYPDTSLVFDGRGWDMHKGRNAAREVFWQGRRFWGGSDYANPERWIYYEIEGLDPEPTSFPNVDGRFVSKRLDFGAPDKLKTIHRLFVRIKQEAAGQIRVALYRFWGDDKKGGYQDVVIDGSGAYKTLVFSIPVAADSETSPSGHPLGEGETFEIRLSSIEGGEWRLDSIDAEVEFHERKATHGFKKLNIVNGGEPA